MYSLGLVLWEVCRRCISDEPALEYAAPYSEWLASGNEEPTLEEMQKLVVVDQCRPPIPNHWSSDPVRYLNKIYNLSYRRHETTNVFLSQTLTGMGALMTECWHSKPSVRLSILRVKKTLVKLASNNPEVDLPLD